MSRIVCLRSLTHYLKAEGDCDLRHSIVEAFQKNVVPSLRLGACVALVGGSGGDPELKKLPPVAKVTFFGIENPSDETPYTYLDLNKLSVVSHGQYDLVLCSQVLEHVWNLSTALQELIRLVNPGGLLWIGVPASNFAHGSPDYYYAGSTPQSLSLQLEKYGLDLAGSGVVGSKRAYIWRHVFRYWSTEQELARPVVSSFSNAFNTTIPAWKRFARSLVSLRSVILLAYDAQTVTDIEFGTETSVLAKKPVEFEELNG